MERELGAEEPAGAKILNREQRRHVSRTERDQGWPCCLGRNCALYSNCSGRPLESFTRGEVLPSLSFGNTALAAVWGAEAGKSVAVVQVRDHGAVTKLRRQQGP